jgi:hypothetical protein
MNDELSRVLDLLQRNPAANRWLDGLFHQLSEMVEDGDRFADAARRALDNHERLNSAIDDTNNALAMVQQPDARAIIGIIRERLPVVAELRQELVTRMDEMEEASLQ